FSLRHLAVLLCAFAIHYSLRWIDSLTMPAFTEVKAELNGKFVPNGHFPVGNSETDKSLRIWGSWAGNDDHHGGLKLGPFRLPSRLSFFVSGNPGHLKNGVYLQDSAGETFRIATIDAGVEWVPVEVDPPPAWVGREVYVLAQDEATGFGGWVGISEPYYRSFSREFSAYIKALTCTGVVCLLLWGWHKKLLSLIQFIPALTSSVAVIMSFAGVLLIGYLAAIIYFLSPACGKIFSFLFLVLGAGFFVLKDKPSPAKTDQDEARMLFLTSAVVFVFYLSVTYLYTWNGDLYALAGNRFSAGLPSDNSLPHTVAERLYHGSEIAVLLGDWQVSDRPPLQSGFLLLTFPLASVLRVDLSLVSALTATLMQISWIPAIYGFLRALSLSPKSALYCTFALSLSGFFIQNSVFTWPKLAGASLCAGAFLILVTRRHDAFSAPLISMLLGLAWLAHGGVAFSFLALAPWLISFVWQSASPVKRVIVMTLLFVLTVLPWVIFQKVYDPPGDRLVKWHLGGQIAPDPRGALETITDAYRSTSLEELIKARISNLKLQIGGGWKTMFSGERGAAHGKKSDEFFFTVRTLAWWLSGLLVLPFAYTAIRRQKPVVPVIKFHASLLAWSLLTYMIWIALMFIPNSAFIHQGSYVSLMALFVLLAAWLSLASPMLISIILALQLYTFMTTYFVSNHVVAGSPDGLVTAFMIASLGLCLIPVRIAEKLERG
ncbi:MAG TPA: hypothetical protein PLN52_21330, partial [Opitutaceae bacterium]|nr:hypothetical protein [Opitutaceae bacterium]